MVLWMATSATMADSSLLTAPIPQCLIQIWIKLSRSAAGTSHGRALIMFPCVHPSEQCPCPGRVQLSTHAHIFPLFNPLSQHSLCLQSTVGTSWTNALATINSVVFWWVLYNYIWLAALAGRELWFKKVEIRWPIWKHQVTDEQVVGSFEYEIHHPSGSVNQSLKHAEWFHNCQCRSSSKKESTMGWVSFGVAIQNKLVCRLDYGEGQQLPCQ